MTLGVRVLLFCVNSVIFFPKCIFKCFLPWFYHKIWCILKQEKFHLKFQGVFIRLLIINVTNEFSAIGFLLIVVLNFLADKTVHQKIVFNAILQVNLTRSVK